MIEVFIHTPEGELKLDDPYKVIGTRGYYVGKYSYPGSKDFPWIVTKESIARVPDLHGNISVTFLRPSERGEYVVTGRSTSRSSYSKKDLRILEPKDKDYFQVKGY